MLLWKLGVRIQFCNGGSCIVFELFHKYHFRSCAAKLKNCLIALLENIIFDCSAHLCHYLCDKCYLFIILAKDSDILKTLFFSENNP